MLGQWNKHDCVADTTDYTIYARFVHFKPLNDLLGQFNGLRKAAAHPELWPRGEISLGMTPSVQ